MNTAAFQSSSAKLEEIHHIIFPTDLKFPSVKTKNKKKNAL